MYIYFHRKHVTKKMIVREEIEATCFVEVPSLQNNVRRLLEVGRIGV